MSLFVIFNLDAQTADEFYKRGELKMKNGDEIGAIDDFTNSIKINPNSSKVYWSRGVAYYNQNYAILAIDDFNKSIELNSDDEIYFYCRALAKTKIEDYKGAIQDFTKTITSNLPESFLAEVLMKRGAAKTQVGDNFGSLNDLNKSIEINPSNAEAYYSRGIAKIILKQYENGCLDLSKSGELGYDAAFDTIRQYCK